MKYALDTNTVIMLLRDTSNVCQKFDEAVEREDALMIPPFVHYEMRRGFLYKPVPSKENSYNILISQYPVGEMNAGAWERAAVLYASLRHAGRTIEDADILIAAFCIAGNYTLVTHNIRHFEGINGLQIEDWAQ